jgi:aminopeptidase-like protein
VKYPIGNEMHSWACDLFPICRSITGDGVRKTLNYIKNLLPSLTVHEVSSGTKAFDWTVPDEWNIRDAYVEDENGDRIIDFKQHNLHVVSYSEPVDVWLSLEELDKRLYSLPDQPNAIPYVSSYYKRWWGFCLTHQQRLKLKPGKYHAVIDSSLKPGSLSYGELILPGTEEKEVLLSTYICHPSMGNNELSGPVVTTALARWLLNLDERRYTYRIVFVPETIGSIVYLSRNLEIMKKNTVAGFVVTCIGDDRSYSFSHSPWGDTLADRVAQHVLKHHAPNYFNYYFWEKGGSDERQYCSPNVRLPVVSVMRSRYGTYPEYHTSLDDLSFITSSGLEGGYEALRKCLIVLENNRYYKVPFPCEPQMGKRGLKPLLSLKNTEQPSTMMRLLNYLDGEHDLLQVCDQIGRFIIDCIPIVNKLLDEKLLVKKYGG